MNDGDKIFEILIVDDNAENLRVLSEVLFKQDYLVRIAKDGVQALSSVQASEPDLILLDGHMPKMDGFEVCKILKSDPDKEIIPIIFLSALTDTFNKLKAFEAGADDYITKPFDLEEIKARVKNYLKVKYYYEIIEDLQKKLKDKEAQISTMKGKKV